MNTKKIPVLLLVIIVSVLTAIQVFAAGPSKGNPKAVPGDFDSYVFSLSWEPAFCVTKPDKKECRTQTPERFDAKNLVLHGLWPNKDSDVHHTYGFCGVGKQIRKLDKPNTWCKMPALDLTDETKKELSVYMPGCVPAWKITSGTSTAPVRAWK